MHALKERHINVDDMTSFPVMRLRGLTAMHPESQNFPWISSWFWSLKLNFYTTYPVWSSGFHFVV